MDERNLRPLTIGILRFIALALVLSCAVALWLGSVWLSLAQAEFGLTPTGEPPTPTATTTTPPVTPMPVTLKVALQPPNAPPPDPAWAVPVRVALHPPGNANVIVHQWNLALDPNGGWNGTLDVAPGPYNVRFVICTPCVT